MSIPSGWFISQESAVCWRMACCWAHSLLATCKTWTKNKSSFTMTWSISRQTTGTFSTGQLMWSQHQTSITTRSWTCWRSMSAMRDVNSDWDNRVFMKSSKDFDLKCSTYLFSNKFRCSRNFSRVVLITQSSTSFENLVKILKTR